MRFLLRRNDETPSGKVLHQLKLRPYPTSAILPKHDAVISNEAIALFKLNTLLRRSEKSPNSEHDSI